MRLPADVRELVRQRASGTCEYCGISETDAGGELTTDHFQPRTKGGSDKDDNLLYCCHRCNQYKADYWPSDVDSPVLWNPRLEHKDTHLLALADGRLLPITVTGEFTLCRLRLNRPALITHRARKRRQAEEQQLLTRLLGALSALEQLHQQHAMLLEEHRTLLDQHRALLRLLLERGRHDLH